MNMQRIAESTGEIDKRHINGNNGTRRGKDKNLANAAVSISIKKKHAPDCERDLTLLLNITAAQRPAQRL